MACVLDTVPPAVVLAMREALEWLAFPHRTWATNMVSCLLLQLRMQQRMDYLFIGLNDSAHAYEIPACAFAGND